VTSSPQRGHAARELLLSAAQELYAAHGVAATTPRQVIELSGVGQGSLYHHFPSKVDLAAEALHRTTTQTLGAASEILGTGLPARGRIESYLRKDRDATAGCRVGRLTADPVVMSHDDLREPVGDYFTDLIQLVAAAFMDDGTPPDGAVNRATAAVAVIQGGFVLSRATGDAGQMQRAVEGFIALMTDGESSPAGPIN